MHHLSVSETASMPAPSDIFLAWLMTRPPGTDMARAASVEIDRLAPYRQDGPRQLAALFEDLLKRVGQRGRA